MNILTLDTSEWNLSKNLKKHSLFIAENNYNEYLSMCKSKPDNVFLHYGDISELSNLITKYQVIYLDFCCSIDSAINSIKKLKNKIDEAILIGFTFCLRKNKKILEDYKFDLINKIQTNVSVNLKVIYGKAYRDKQHAPMITLFFENTKFLNNKKYNKKEKTIKKNLLPKNKRSQELAATYSLEVLQMTKKLLEDKNKHQSLVNSKMTPEEMAGKYDKEALELALQILEGKADGQTDEEYIISNWHLLDADDQAVLKIIGINNNKSLLEQEKQRLFREYDCVNLDEVETKINEILKNQENRGKHSN